MPARTLMAINGQSLFLAALDNHHGFLWPVCHLSLERYIQGSHHAG
jgi:hypothetical protein